MGQNHQNLKTEKNCLKIQDKVESLIDRVEQVKFYFSVVTSFF